MANKIFISIIVVIILIAFYLISPYRYKSILNQSSGMTTAGGIFITVILDTWTGESWWCYYGYNNESKFQVCHRRIKDGEALNVKDETVTKWKRPLSKE